MPIASSASHRIAALTPEPHIATIVVGGTSAEFALKTAKYASARYLDDLPSKGSMLGHGFRDRELELEQLEREAIPIPRQWEPPRPTAGEPPESWRARVRSWTEEHSGLGQI